MRQSKVGLLFENCPKRAVFFLLKRDKYPSGSDRIALTDRHDWPGMIEVLVGEPYSEMLGDLMPKI